jgi:hypothetical protein
MSVPTVFIEKPASLELEIKARDETVRNGIAGRLKKACSYMTDPEFVVLVDKIATVQLTAERAWAAKAYASA